MPAVNRRKPVCLEMLEQRVLLSASSSVNLSLDVQPAASVTGTPQSLSPAMVEQAYDLNDITFSVSGQSVAANGAGETIAIVDAYSDPNITSDLETFDANFGISNDNSSGQLALTVATPEGAGATNAGWATEQSLDVEWAHAIAPGASILLVEAPSSSFNDLMNAVTWASDQPGVVAVSMSWGDSPEFAGETAYDSDFTTPSGHVGVTYVAAAGDDALPNYPSTSPNVLAVGGTTLSVNDSGDWLNETYWSEGGGGVSPYEHTNKPDVAYDGNPDTGVLVYDSIPYEGNDGWQVVGGTSAGSPQWAAIIAIADQGLALRSMDSLNGPSQTIPDLYALPSSDFNSITGGGLVGLGSPIGEKIIAGLVGGGITVGPPTQLVFSQQPTNITAGQTISPAITVDIEDAAGDIVTSDNTDITLSVASGPGNLTGTIIVQAVDGVATFSNVSVNEAGTYALSAADGSLSTATSSHFTVSQGQLVFVQQPSSALAGAAISPSVEVAIETAGGSVIDSNATITLSLASGSGSLAGTTTVQASDGVATFSNLSVGSAGTFSLAASGSLLTGADSTSFTITEPHLVFIQQPASALSGANFSTPIEVEIEDPDGNIVDSNSTVTLSLSSGPGNLSGTLTAQADNGIATFSSLALSAAGSCIIQASDSPYTSAVSTAIAVTAPQLVFAQQPVGTLAGFALSPAVSVEFENAGALVANDDSTVTLSVASGPGNLSGTLTATAVNGVATFSGVALKIARQYQLSATSPTASSATSDSFTISAPGSVDVANWGQISGWAYDPSDPSAAIDVEVVFSDGPTQTFLADNTRTDLEPYIGSSNHGFDYSTPMLTTGSHTASIYEILTNGSKVLLSTQTIVSQNSLFDESYYLQQYPNVAAAVADGQFSSGYAHYLQYGQYEGYSPNPYWDESWYLAENPDVAAAVNDGQVSSGFMQYYDYGQYENRGGLLYFDTTYYLQNNPDVAAAITAGTVASAFEHFCDFGQYEGRNPMEYFSFSVYEADNQDIMPYITGEPFTSAYQQFIEYGQYEDRVASDYYNEQIYLADNSDVAAAVSNGEFPDGLQQWLEYGQYEGRTAV